MFAVECNTMFRFETATKSDKHTLRNTISRFAQKWSQKVPKITPDSWFLSKTGSRGPIKHTFFFKQNHSSPPKVDGQKKWLLSSFKHSIVQNQRQMYENFLANFSLCHPSLMAALLKRGQSEDVPETKQNDTGNIINTLTSNFARKNISVPYCPCCPESTSKKCE